MADVIILYHSEHHGNTKKLVEGIAKAYPVDLVEIPSANKIDFSGYKAIGFASGVYMSKLHKSLFDALDSSELPKSNPKAFILYTSGNGIGKYAAALENRLTEKNFEVLGTYDCRGYDTVGPFKLVGGLCKGHPSEEDIADAVSFYKKKVLPKLK